MANEKINTPWAVKLTGAAEKALTDSPALSEDDKRVIVDWARTVQKDGPEGLRKDATRVKKWNDHELKGKWAGFRSSSFSTAGRVTYKGVGRLVLVAVVRITTTHDYGDPRAEELKELKKLEADLKKASLKEKL